MSRRLDESDAADLGVRARSFPFGGGWLSLAHDEDGVAHGSAFDVERATSLSRALGETIERRTVWQAWGESVPHLETSIRHGGHASAFAFASVDADRRARLELEARRARDDLWHGAATPIDVPLPAPVAALARRTGRSFVMLEHPSRPRWLALLSERDRASGVLYSDGCEASRAEGLASAVREHLMLVACEHLGVARVPRLERRLDELCAWLSRPATSPSIRRRSLRRRRRHRVATLGWVTETWMPEVVLRAGARRDAAAGWIPWEGA